MVEETGIVMLDEERKQRLATAIADIKKYELELKAYQTEMNLQIEAIRKQYTEKTKECNEKLILAKDRAARTVKFCIGSAGKSFVTPEGKPKQWEFLEEDSALLLTDPVPQQRIPQRPQ